MPSSTKTMERQLAAWSEQCSDAALIRQAEALALRQDMTTFLTFVRDSRVIGTQGTGNMPLKAVHEVTARFVDPPRLEATIGDHVYKIRSEADLWPLYYLHILADVGGWLKTGSARRWRITARGQEFLDAPPMLQTSWMLAVWWYRVNWLVAYSYTGMGKALPPLFNRAVLTSLQALALESWHPFEKFADHVIRITGLTWGARDSSVGTMALRGSIGRMVIDRLAEFGVLERRYETKPLGRGTISELTAFKITPLGAALLDALAPC